MPIGQFDLAQPLDFGDYFTQVLFEIIARVDRERRGAFGRSTDTQANRSP